MDGPPRLLVGTGASPSPLFHCLLYLALCIVFYVYECFVCMYVCVAHACSDHRGTERASDPQEMKLQWL